ncbi:unnamed protein product [Paramecium sonneborni]|uniref:Uncharacterized protein n=1 Tax=Paramecium sonneborni TaxID=65129 RepID=A0A8S1KPX7_9CILI|nr:unnamed protein product [Paramecium sonneborni]
MLSSLKINYNMEQLKLQLLLQIQQLVDLKDITLLLGFFANVLISGKQGQGLKIRNNQMLILKNQTLLRNNQYLNFVKKYMLKVLKIINYILDTKILKPFDLIFVQDN